MLENEFHLRRFAIDELHRLTCSFPCKKGVPMLVWNTRLRTSAGRYRRARHLIELNPHLLTDVERVKITLGHEYAHAMAIEQTMKEPPHGPAWQDAMQRLGLPAEVYHRYDVRNLKRTPKQLKTYECPVCSIRWQVRRRYPDHCYHRCEENTQRVRIKFVGVEEV